MLPARQSRVLPGGGDPMRLTRVLALGASVLVLVSACSSGGGSKPTVKVGSDGFYEAKLMAEIYAQALEAGGYTVDRTGIGIGSRKVSAPALESGQIDLKPEYIGSGLAFYEPGKQTGDPAANEAALQAVMATKGGGITVLDYSPAADQNAFVVRKDTAAQFNLARLSDTTAVQNQLKWGLATDCKTNPVCAAALKSAYGLDPTNITPLVRDDLLAKVDKTAFEKILNDVSAKMDTATLTDLNKQISVDKEDIAAVAKAWLKAVGLVSNY